MGFNFNIVDSGEGRISPLLDILVSFDINGVYKELLDIKSAVVQTPNAYMQIRWVQLRCCPRHLTTVKKIHLFPSLTYLIDPELSTVAHFEAPVQHKSKPSQP